MTTYCKDFSGISKNKWGESRGKTLNIKKDDISTP